MKEEQGQQQNEKTEISLAEIFFLNPEIKKGLHPHAAERYYTWLAEVFQEIAQLTTGKKVDVDVDIDTYLNDDDKTQVEKYKQNILEWLHKCTNIGKGYSLYPYASWVIYDMSELKRLVKTAYERKEAKVREEERKREEDRQWEAASLHVFPFQLSKDADCYLSNDEQEKFLKAAGVAINVYLKQGDSYLDNYKTFDYRRWLKEINYRKEEEQIRNDAQAQAQAFRARLDQGLKEIGKILSPKKEDPTIIFKRWCSNNGENRYLEETFIDILASGDADEYREWMQGHVPAAEAKLRKSIPKELQNFILTKPTAAFFLLPGADYSYCGVPCLDFYFAVYAVVTITVLAQAGHKVFNDHKFNFLKNLQEPKCLGFYQIIITPDEPHFWQSIPLTILYTLINGNVQPPGTTILERTDRLTIYEVKKFEEGICEIPVSFERYCRSLGSIEKMKEVQIIKERTAEILGPLRPMSTNHNESKSKKAQAFEFFSEGKRPSDSEVKNLGIKPATTYRYYQQWKRVSDSR